jgi:cytoskeletal protein RodZ
MNALEELAAELRDRRRLLGLSREEAYKKFRVPLDVVVALEEGTLDRLPAPVYARGFLRTYCEGLGLPPDPRLDKLEEALHQRPRFRMPFFRGPDRERPAWFDDVAMWGAIAGIVVFGWIAYSLVFDPGRQAHETGVQAQTVDFRGEDPFAAP